MSHTVDFLTLTCPAKVNLALSVASPLASGMHPIVSWMVALNFGDILTLHRMPDDIPASSFSMAYASDAPRRQAIDWPLEKDLAYRAHALLESKLQKKLPIQAQLIKWIPTGAGLGGGSSNAAAMLVGLNRLYKLDLSTETLCQWSTELGSDIAFLIGALMGEPSAIIAGTGEQFIPARRETPIHLTLIFPPASCPTGPVYKAFDQLLEGKEKPVEFERVRAQAASRQIQAGDPFNDLAKPACVVAPVLSEAKKTCESLLKQPVHITGSGAAMFTLARNADHARDMAITLTRDAHLPTLATHTLV